MRRKVIGGAALAALWFVFGWVPFVLQGAGGSLATLGQLVPSPMRYGVWALPFPWGLIVQVLVAVTLTAGYALLVTWVSARGHVTLASGWLAAVLASFLIGASLDIGNFVVWVGQFGVRGAAGTTGVTPLSVWWAVLVGWIPALLTTRARRGHDAQPARRVATDAAPASDSQPSLPVVILTVVAIIGMIGLPLASQAGHASEQQQLRQDQAQAESRADPDGAAPADPEAAGNPVPPVAPTTAAVSDDTCTAEDTTILAPPADAATGHRGQSLQLVNTSDAACVVDGYPDIAYGDQNGHLLDATVEQGRSFMADDPGAHAITLEPGDAAFAVAGWDANSVQGQLAARSLWVAAYPGARRLTWDVSLDIIPGATVHVTAWHVRDLTGD